VPQHMLQVIVQLTNFTRSNSTSRPLDCGLHNCSKPCHPPPHVPATCPLSPSLVTTCPCGKHSLIPTEASHFPPNSKLTRTKCSDKIPTCNSTCLKPLEGCLHPCSVPCHTGQCPPCTVKVVRPCRCGATTRDIKCYEDQLGPAGEILCDKQCTALRACGRHQCNRVCCPLASLAAVSKSKGKRRALEEPVADEHGWHVCDLVCGKPLSCGNHRCEEPDHKGPCPPCLRSSFEEVYTADFCTICLLTASLAVLLLW
jgi:transcriptional repressor NF-X1